MSDSRAMTPAQKAIGDFAPKLVSLADDVLFGDVWERTELSKRDRSLITVAALITTAVPNSSGPTSRGPRTTV
jgi:4-carboxymuconolactone decarboxylase